MDSDHIKKRRRRSWYISKNRSLNWPVENIHHVKPSARYSVIVLSFETDTSKLISLNGQSAEMKLQRQVAADALLGPPVANPYIRALAKRLQLEKLEHTAEIRTYCRNSLIVFFPRATGQMTIRKQREPFTNCCHAGVANESPLLSGRNELPA